MGLAPVEGVPYTMSRCLWCGDPYEGAEQFCDLCGANPNVDRFRPHTVHTGQFFEVDFDLFCARAGVEDAVLDFEPTQEQIEATARYIDRVILGKVHEELDKARLDQREPPTDDADHRGMSEADRGE